MIAGLIVTAALSLGAVSVTLQLHPLAPFAAFALGIAVLAIGPRVRWSLSERDRDLATRAAVAFAVLAAVGDRHLLVASRAVAPDDVLAAIVVIGALVLPAGPRWRAAGAGVAVAAYVAVAATLIVARPYESDAVAAAHGAAELLLEGRHPYADFDLVEQLARFGLPPEYATPLEDGTRLRSLDYPALAFLVPAPFVAAGLTDVRILYLAELLGLFALVTLSAAPRSRGVVLAVCLGNLVVLDQHVAAGVDPLWAVLLVGAFLAREHRWSAILLGLAVATRQTAWLVAPFLIALAWRENGGRAALERAAAAAVVAVAVHLPFAVSAPLAVARGLTDVALLPLEPYGIGPAGLGAAGILPLLPRGAYLAAFAALWLLSLWAFMTWRADPRRALVWPLAALFVSWRALQSYFGLVALVSLARADAPPTDPDTTSA